MKTHLTTDQLRDPAVMLETLRLAYQFTCDVTRAPFARERRRLTDHRQRILGRRLATYWSMKP